jgi:ATP-dependent DNA helicase RecQ
MSGKPVAEQEIGFALLQEVVAYAEIKEKILPIILVNLTVKTGEGADMDNVKTKNKSRSQRSGS